MRSAATDGDTIVVSAPSNDNVGGTFAGAAYVYTPVGTGGYTQTAKLVASDGADFDFFGWSVAVDGDGVPNAADDCAATPLPDQATKQLKPRHYETVDGDNDGDYEFVDPDGNVTYTLDDTRGCSLSQIVEEADLGKAHGWYGISGSALDAW